MPDLPAAPARLRRGEELGSLLRRRGGAAGEGRRSLAPELDGGERLLVLDHLILAIGSAYAHLPAKRAAYAVEPVQALTLLRRRATELSDAELHAEISRIVTGLRDAHTRYIGPERLHQHVAALPFLVEQYGPLDQPTYLVTKVNAAALDGSELEPGCRLEHWNGIPIERAVQLQADRETGGRPDSRRSRALESLTSRAMEYGPPPDEDWVIVGFRTRTGKRAEVRLDWRVIYPGDAETAVSRGSLASLRVAADPAAEWVRRGKSLQFAPQQWVAGQLGRSVSPPSTGPGEWLESSMPDVLSAKRWSNRLGYLRIWSFNVDDDTAFVDELVRLLAQLPPEGLVIDLRGNPGGLIWAAERALQLFTDAPIAPVRFAPVASAVMRELASSPFNRMELEQWAPSLEDAVSTGELYGQPLPLTDPAWCNDVGRKYAGPVVVVADPNTYSSGDIFCAGFVDHEIGPLVIANGTATGAGGANVWSSHQLRDAMAGLEDALPPMPRGTGYTLALRRVIRSGCSDGIPLEDLGVSGTSYPMTRRDLLEGNADLIRFAASLLT